MAEFRLEPHEAEMGYLPPICMRCGAPATCVRQKHFKNSPASGGVVATWLVAPLCDAHRGHWRVRALVTFLTLLGVVIANCAGLSGLVAAAVGNETIDQLFWPVVGTAFVAWIVLTVILYRGSIRVAEIGPDGLLVTGIAHEFAVALIHHRKSPQRDVSLTLPGVEQTRLQVRLFRDDASALPPICICCGEPATQRISKKYTTKIRKEPSSGEAVGALVLGAMGGFMISSGEIKGRPWQVQLPVCDRHRTYWRNRLLIIAGGFLFPVVMLLGVLVGKPSPDTGFIGGWCVVAIVLWAFASIFVYELSTKPADVAENSLVLRGVSPRFVEAVEQQRRLMKEGPQPQAPWATGSEEIYEAKHPDRPGAGEFYGPRSP